ncbi:malto-oligosyltrehalose trehalohydrolase [soil metagenome]
MPDLKTPYDAHGPLPHGDGTVTFRVWAPRAARVHLVLDDAEHALEPAAPGWFARRLTAAGGDRYGFRLDGGPLRPDPASLRQPDGVHQPSALVDSSAFAWSAAEATWRPPPLAGAVVYELHVGTFTADGTFTAAVAHLDALAELGVTHVEVMPVNAFNGVRNWGYDGVGWYAVHEGYGGPEGLAGFVDACHRTGLAVLLDVVHNHLGPSGNYLPEFGPYLLDGRASAWGQGVNLDGPGSDAVRAFVIGNALAWLERYHLDGLRLDAVHALLDTSAVPVLAELAGAVDALSVRRRKPHLLIAESDRNDPQTVRPRLVGGLGLDGQWADDLHHAIHTAVTRERDGYYGDFSGLPDVARAYRRGFVYDGERYSPYRQRHVGAPLPDDVSGHRLVACVQNHDQVGNRAAGDRLTALVGADLARVALLLLCAAPHTPLLFMGEEYGETRPFQFFTAHPEPDLAEAVRAGRREEFAAFESWQGQVPDPQDVATQQRSTLDRDMATTAAGHARLALVGDLIRARRAHDALGNGRRDLVETVRADDEVLAVIRSSEVSPPVMVVANLGARAARIGVPIAAAWTPLLDTAEITYGGDGTVTTSVGDAVTVPSRSAALLRRAG